MFSGTSELKHCARCKVCVGFPDAGTRIAEGDIPVLKRVQHPMAQCDLLRPFRHTTGGHQVFEYVVYGLMNGLLVQSHSPFQWFLLFVPIFCVRMGQVWLDLRGLLPRVSTAFNPGAATPLLRGGRAWRLIVCRDRVNADGLAKGRSAVGILARHRGHKAPGGSRRAPRDARLSQRVPIRLL